MAEDSPKKSKGLPAWTSTWVGLAGLILAACSLLTLLILIAYDLIHGFKQPYVGVFVYLVLPGLVFAGFAMIGLSAWHQRRRQRKPGVPQGLPRLDLNDPRQRRNVVLVMIFGFLFLLFSAFGSYRAYQVTESVAFCGRLCHQVMDPQYTAYLNSPHARVRCTECHIGPGAEWYVRTKLSGLQQVYAVLVDSYPRPIPVPVKNLRPARGTCEQCHWPEKFYGDLEFRRRHYLSDPSNTPFDLRLLLKVGGANPLHGPVGGIHWHMVVNNKIEYIPADESRQIIPWVRVTNRETGRVAIYRSQTTPLPAKGKRRPLRRMDCIDCHNRPTHIFNSPNETLDVALWLNRIDPSIPSIKLNAARALVESTKTASKNQGLERIAKLLSSKYPNYAEQRKIREAITVTQAIFHKNIFPVMKTNWQVRPDNIGHLIWSGCFRCHDGEHVNENKKTVSANCNACHTIISQKMGDQPQKTDLAGMKFDHPGGKIPPGLMCKLCHSGAP
jgi:nitrate/TMAO reductase-like tetraheme cytochrome c subunit